MTRRYPDEPAGSFPEPPREFTDDAGRVIRITEATGEEQTPLLEMYLDFDPADRAQGIPPSREPAIERWLDNVLREECLNVVAWSGEAAVGHAMLVPDEREGNELAIFVLDEYQGAGIGTALVETLLGDAQAAGIERVWLTVERWNEPAINLYEKVGFEISDAERFELEMAIRLH